MPDLIITRCKDPNGNDIQNAVVLAISELDLLSSVSNTSEGQNLPSVTFFKGNRTNSSGQCVISVPATSNKAIVAYVKQGGLTGIHCHIDVSS